VKIREPAQGKAEDLIFTRTLNEKQRNVLFVE
jgi:hypothetical protein